MEPRVPGMGVSSSMPEETVVEWHCAFAQTEDFRHIKLPDCRLIHRRPVFEHRISHKAEL
jgi:hypothetical protein